MNGHDSDCNCIDCLCTNMKMFGQTATPSLDTATGVPLPAPGILPPAPTPAPSSPSEPNPPSMSWINQMMAQLTPPGQMPDPMTMQTLMTTYNAGVTAYQQLIAQNYVFHGSILTPTLIYQSDDMANQFFYSNSADLVSLQALVQPILPQQITDMCNWLAGVSPNTTYSPAQMIQLVNKLIFGQSVSFPSIEMPARIIAFMSHVLRTTVTGSQESQLQAQQDTLRSQMYAAMTTVFNAQAAYTLAQQENQSMDSISVANGVVASAQSTLQGIQDEITTINAELTDLQQVTLNSTQLVQYLIANLPASPEATELTNTYNSIQASIVLFHQIIDPILAAEAAQENLMAPDQAAVTAAQTAFNTAQAPINDAADTYTQPTAAQTAAFQEAQDMLAAAQANLAPYTQEMLSLSNQIAQAYSNNPSFQQNGLLITDPSLIDQLLTSALTTLANSNPADMMDVLQDSMAVEASAADARTAVLQNEQQEAIAAKQSEFQAYYQAQAEAKLQFYTDQFNNAQAAYNSLSGTLTAMAASIQALQDEISQYINALGQIIGWWCHENNLDDSVMNQPYFIGVALQAVVSLNGSFDTVTIPGTSQTETFWNQPGSSAALAGQTITLMDQMTNAQVNYNNQAPGLVAEQNAIGTWMNQLNTAIQVANQLVNSNAYIQMILDQYNATPEAELLQTDIDQIVTPLKQIANQVAADQNTLQAILNDLEVQVLAGQGVNISDLNLLSYTDQKNLWVGVNDYLVANLPQLSFVQQTIATITDAMNAGTAQESDANNLAVAQTCILNITAAQCIQRQLQNNASFQQLLTSDADSDTQAAVTAQAQAAGSAAQTGSQAVAATPSAPGSQVGA